MKVRRLIQQMRIWRARAREAIGFIEDMEPTRHALLGRLARALEREAALTVRVAEIEKENRALRAEVREHEESEAALLRIGVEV